MCPWHPREDEDDIYVDEGRHPQDVVACPGIAFPSLQNSCYVPIEKILPHIEDE